MKTLRSEGSEIATDELYALACKPELKVHYYPFCIVNGVRFRRRDRDERRKTQNSGVSVLADYEDAMIDYYGYLTNVVVLDYMFDFQVELFECEWYDTNPRQNRLRKDHHFISVNTSKKWFVEDPYILAIQAKQVFYVDDLKLGKDWKVVQKVQQRQVWTVQEKEDDDGDLDVLNEPYQQDEYDTNLCEVDVNDIVCNLRRDDDVDLIDLTEQQMEEMRQTDRGIDDSECNMLSDTDDECLDENDSNDDSD